MKNETLRWLLLAFLIGAPSVRVFIWGDSTGGTLLAAVGAAALLLTRMSDISVFEFFQLKVRLERQTQQVEVTLQQLQKMAASFAQANLSQLAMSGQILSAMNTSYKFEMHNQIIDSLKEIGLDDNAIMEAQSFWVAWYCRMILSRIKGVASELLPDTKVQSEIETLPVIAHPPL